MNELRNRFRTLLTITTDPIRHTEHSTLNRLLYKNRNQHRHGLYFRRLEHVRRLLRKLNTHDAWQSVHHALGEAGYAKEQRARAKKTPLSLSSVTLDDLHSVEKILHALVHTVIPTAACKVTAELVCREHFLPFAVTVIAILARLFVIERKLLTEVRGALVEARLLFGMTDTQMPQHCQNGQSREGLEDIGEQVEQSSSVIHPLTHGYQVTFADKSDDQEEKVTSHISISTRGEPEDNKMSKREPLTQCPSTDTPSLYAVMAEYNKSAASVAQLSTGSLAVQVVPTPVLESKQSGPSKHTVRESLPNASKRIKVAVQGSGDNLAEPRWKVVQKSAPESRRNLVSAEVKHNQPSQPPPNLSTPSSPSPEAKENSSAESDDIEDIFAALDD